MRRLVGLLLLAGCSSQVDSTPPVILTGIYSGTLTMSSSPGSGFGGTVVMTQTSHSTVEGTMSLPQGTLPLPFVGTYARDTVTLVVTAPLPYVAGGTGKFAVSDAGKHLVGTLVGDYGSFDGQTFSLDVSRH